MYGSASAPPPPQKKGNCSILILDSISDVLCSATTSKWISGLCLLTFQLQGTQWTSEYWWTCKRCSPAVFPHCCCGGKKRRKVLPFGSPGSVEPLSIFRLSPVKFRERYQSHFEALGRHLFVRDVKRCSVDCANFSNPTYSSSSHKHTHMPYTEEHLLLSSAFRVPGISIWKGVCTVALWLREPLKLCQRLSANSKIRHSDCLGWTTVFTVM